MEEIILLSDIHGNYDALKEVWNHIEDNYMYGSNRSSVKFVILGDIVDYGPNPNMCLEFIEDLRRNFEVISILGNHDELIYNMLTNRDLNYEPDKIALISSMITRNMISKDLLMNYVSNSSMYWVDNNNILYTHANPVDNYDDRITRMAKYFSLTGVRPQIAVQGHTHIPALCRYTIGGSEVLVLNPGSIGQPRDLDPRASYGVLAIDDKGVFQDYIIHRVAYDVPKVQGKLAELEFPDKYIERLSSGD